VSRVCGIALVVLFCAGSAQAGRAHPAGDVTTPTHARICLLAYRGSYCVDESNDATTARVLFTPATVVSLTVRVGSSIGVRPGGPLRVALTGPNTSLKATGFASNGSAAIDLGAPHLLTGRYLVHVSYGGRTSGGSHFLPSARTVRFDLYRGPGGPTPPRTFPDRCGDSRSGAHVDVKAASIAQTGRNLVFTVHTCSALSGHDVAGSPIAPLIGFWIPQNVGAGPQRLVFIRTSGEILGLYARGGHRGTFQKLSPTEVRYVVPLAQIGKPIAFRWYAIAYDRGRITDAAPDQAVLFGTR